MSVVGRGVGLAGAALIASFLLLITASWLEKQSGWSRWLFRALGLGLGASYSLLGFQAVLAFYVIALLVIGIGEWSTHQEGRIQVSRQEKERAEMLAAWSAEDADRNRPDRKDG